MDTNSFISKSKQIFSDKFDYSLVEYKDQYTLVHELQHALQHFDDRLEILNKNTILLDLVSLYKDQISLSVLDKISYYLYWSSFSEKEAR